MILSDICGVLMMPYSDFKLEDVVEKFNLSFQKTDPFEIFLALPYLMTIIALALAGRNVMYPSAYLKPYRRE